MSGWTTSCHWGGVTRDKLRGLLRHDARDLDRKQGKEVNHSNELLDGRLTDLNVTYGMRDGEFVALDSVDEILSFVDEKVASAKRPTYTKKDPETGEETVHERALRKDAAVVTEFILQLDPKWMREGLFTEEEFLTSKEARVRPAVELMSPEKMKRTVELLHVMRDAIIDEFGADKIAWISEHWDESNPHIQMGLVSLDDEGYVNKTSMFHGGKGKRSEAQKFYQKLHDDVRTRLLEHGYEATMERTSDGKHRTIDEVKARNERETAEWQALKRAKDAEKEAEQARAEAREIGYAEGKEAARHAARKVNAKLTEKAQSLDAREASLGAREAAVNDAERDAALVRENARRDADRKRAEADDEARELTAKARADQQAAEAARRDAEDKLRQANEKLANASVGMSSEASFRDLLQTMAKHPAFSDAAKEAAQAMQRAVYPLNRKLGTSKDARNIDGYLKQRAEQLKQRRAADMRAAHQAATFETGRGGYGLGE